MAASHFGVGSLVCVVDRNQLCIDGPTEQVMAVEPIDERFAAFGWQVQRIGCVVTVEEHSIIGGTGPGSRCGGMASLMSTC
jgi:transketolase N-terminal domain/subunit